jgi:hypothetical protein
VCHFGNGNLNLEDPNSEPVFFPKFRRFLTFDDFAMTDKASVHVVGHTISKDGMVQPFHFTLADNQGLVISRHGMRDMESAELNREDTWWEHKRVSDLLDELKTAPAWLHPKYVPVDTSRAQVNVSVLPRAEVERSYEESLPLGLPTTKVMLNMWGGAFDQPTGSRPTSP